MENIKLPITEEAVRRLRVGDQFTISGTIITGRDAAHKRLLLEDGVLPLDLAGGALYHAGPIMAKNPDGSFRVVVAGPTTSMRMERLEGDFLAQTGIRIVIGKGGMGPKMAEACSELGAVHAIFPGGCAVLAAKQIKEVVAVHWLDLGMPEAVWVCRVEEFGPLIVTIDSTGQNLFEDNKAVFHQNLDEKFAQLRGFGKP